MAAEDARARAAEGAALALAFDAALERGAFDDAEALCDSIERLVEARAAAADGAAAAAPPRQAPLPAPSAAAAAATAGGEKEKEKAKEKEPLVFFGRPLRQRIVAAKADARRRAAEAGRST